MKKIIITGSTGFIGSHLIYKLIDNNFNVGVFCRKESKIIYENEIQDKIKIYKVDSDVNKMIEAFNEFKPEYVIYLASYFKSDHTKDDIDIMIDSNIKFSTIILEAMRICNIKKIINVGTAWQNYNNEKYNPVCLYAATKEAFEKIIDYYVKALMFRCITLELFDSYGDNDNRGKLVSSLKKAALNNSFLNMTQGENKIDLTYIDDITNGFICAIEYINNMKFGENKKYSICTGRVLTLKQVIKIFEKTTGYKLNINWGGREYREREVMEPWNKYECLPNWKCTYSLEEGLKNI